MQAVSVTCNHCGAPLTVGETTRFATCKHCGRQLKIVHGESSTYTEVLEAVAGHTEQIARDTAVIRLQNELEQIDREWQADRERYFVSTKNGHREPPSMGGIAAAGVAAVFGIGWMIFASQMGAPAIFPLFGLVFIAVAVIGVFSGMSKLQGHESAETVYRKRRAELLAKLRDAQGER